MNHWSFFTSTWQLINLWKSIFLLGLRSNSCCLFNKCPESSCSCSSPNPQGSLWTLHWRWNKIFMNVQQLNLYFKVCKQHSQSSTLNLSHYKFFWFMTLPLGCLINIQNINHSKHNSLLPKPPPHCRLPSLLQWQFLATSLCQKICTHSWLSHHIQTLSKLTFKDSSSDFSLPSILVWATGYFNRLLTLLPASAFAYLVHCSVNRIIL